MESYNLFKRTALLILMIYFAIGCEQMNDSSIDHTTIEDTHNNQHKSSVQRQVDQDTLYDHDALEQKGKQSKLNIHFIDVDHAEATLFEWEENGEKHAFLYDTGAWNENNVIEYLKLQEIESIDLIVISHPHKNHIGQLAMIVEEFDVKEVWFSGNITSSKIFERAVEAIMASGANYHEPRKGEITEYGPLTIETLHPESLSGNIKEDSIVLRIHYGDKKILLTGDIYETQELELIRNHDSIEANILQLGNHGADTSSNQHFLNAVKPDLAIYSTGENNPYDYPHEIVISTLNQLGIPIYGTEQDGTIIIETDGKYMDILTKKRWNYIAN